MSARICGAIGAEYINANDFEKIFTSRESKYIRSKFEVREKPKIGCGADGCKTNLFLVFSSMAPGITIFSQKRKEPIRM